MEESKLAIEALKLSQNWSLWIMGIQSGAIGFLGLLYKDGKYNFWPKSLKIFYALTFLCFLISIFFANFLQGGIPSVASQLIFINDFAVVPDKSIFYMNFPRTWTTSLALWGHLQTSFFMLGIVLFSITMFLHSLNRSNDTKSNITKQKVLK